MPDQKPIYEVKITRYNFLQLYPNRVTISEGTFAGTEHTILMRQIASVSLEGPAKILKIVTVGGETYKPKFIAGKVAQEVQNIILQNIP